MTVTWEVEHLLISSIFYHQNLRVYELAPSGLSFRLRSRTLATGPTADVKGALKALAPPQHQKPKSEKAVNTNARAGLDPSRFNKTKALPILTTSNPTNEDGVSHAKSSVAPTEVRSRGSKSTKDAPSSTSAASKPTNGAARALASGSSATLEGTLIPPAPPNPQNPEQKVAMRAKATAKAKAGPSPSRASKSIKASSSSVLIVSKSKSGANAPRSKSSCAHVYGGFKATGSLYAKGGSSAKGSSNAKGTSNAKGISNAKGAFGMKGSYQSSDFIASFFAEYLSFDYNPRKPVMREFARMRTHFRWNPKDKENSVAQKAWSDFKTALVLQFNKIYGTNVNDIQAWQLLCRIVGIEVPDTLKGCREVCISRLYYWSHYMSNERQTGHQEYSRQSRRFGRSERRQTR